MKKISIPISIITLKDKTELKVSRETGERIQAGLNEATQHLFVTIKELNNKMVNSAEIKYITHTADVDYQEEKEPEMSDEDRVIAQKKIREIREEFEQKGIFPKKV